MADDKSGNKSPENQSGGNQETKEEELILWLREKGFDQAVVDKFKKSAYQTKKIGELSDKDIDIIYPDSGDRPLAGRLKEELAAWRARHEKRAFTTAPEIPLAVTPDYLKPKMDGVLVSEPAVYRSLYVLDTIDTPTSMDCQTPGLWRPDPDNAEAVVALGRGGVVFNKPKEENTRFYYSVGLPPQGRIVSFEHSEGDDVGFYFDIGVTTFNQAVEWLRVTSNPLGEPYYEKDTKLIHVPIGHASSWRETRVEVADLVQKLASDRLDELGEFVCGLSSGVGPLYFRELKVNWPSRRQELDRPLDPFALSDDDLGTSQIKPAVGALMVHRQGWVQQGLAIGNLVQSVCLAPGEVTQVAVVDWRRKTTGISEEATIQEEKVESNIKQDRAVNEVQNAVANELQQGGSSTSAASASVQAGVAVSTLFASASASASATTSNALTAQFSVGRRNLEAASTNAINARTAEKSQALRSRRQSVVREVSEQEAETLSTRVLANYNRRHTLNIEFFEVLQLYKIETKILEWERCLFVPLVPLDFTKPVIEKHRTQLINIFRELGAEGLLGRMADLAEDEEKRKNQQKEVEQRIAKLAVAAGLVPQLRSLFERLRTLDRVHSSGLAQGMASFNEGMHKYSSIGEEIGTTLPNFENPNASNIILGLIEKETKRKAMVAVPLEEVLNSDRMFLSQQIWLRMNPYRIYCMLQGYKVAGKPLSMLVDPHPVGVFGNYLAFRWGFERAVEREEFEKTYIKRNTSNNGRETDSGGKTADADTVQEEGLVVALPTSGVFAEAVLGQGVAAELKDEFHYGRWDDDVIPILPPKIAQLTSRDRAKGMDLKAQDFASSLAQLRAEKLADISQIEKVLGQVGKGDMFRNMGGLAEAVSLADKVAAISGEGATKAGERAVDLHKKMLDTFVNVLDSEVGKAAVAEFMLPGAGNLLLTGAKPDAAAKNGGSGAKNGDSAAVLSKEGEQPKAPAQH